jgi:hypothetical protein
MINIRHADGGNIGYRNVLLNTKNIMGHVYTLVIVGLSYNKTLYTYT